MKTLSEVRTYVREYLDLDSEDISDTLLDSWAATSYRRIIRSRRHWPHLEAVVSLSVISGTQSYALTAMTTSDTYLRYVVGIDIDDQQIVWMGHQEAVSRYGATPSTGRPRHFSEYGGSIYFWPKPGAAYTASVMGYRHFKTTWLAGTGTPDLPDDYEGPLLSWVMCEAAKHENDLAAAQTYAADFDIELTEINANTNGTTLHGPLIMNGGNRPQGYGALGYYGLYDELTVS